jgi:hypothetical protein
MKVDDDVCAHWGCLDGQAVSSAVTDRLSALKMTQTALAEELGVSRASVTMMLRDGPATFHSAHRLCSAVGLSLVITFKPMCALSAGAKETP